MATIFSIHSLHGEAEKSDQHFVAKCVTASYHPLPKLQNNFFGGLSHCVVNSARSGLFSPSSAANVFTHLGAKYPQGSASVLMANSHQLLCRVPSQQRHLLKGWMWNISISIRIVLRRGIIIGFLPEAG